MISFGRLLALVTFGSVLAGATPTMVSAENLRTSVPVRTAKLTSPDLGGSFSDVMTDPAIQRQLKLQSAAALVVASGAYGIGWLVGRRLGPSGPWVSEHRVRQRPGIRHAGQRFGGWPEAAGRRPTRPTWHRRSGKQRR